MWLARLSTVTEHCSCLSPTDFGCYYRIINLSVSALPATTTGGMSRECYTCSHEPISSLKRQIPIPSNHESRPHQQNPEASDGSDGSDGPTEFPSDASEPSEPSDVRATSSLERVDFYRPLYLPLHLPPSYMAQFCKNIGFYRSLTAEALL